MNTGKEKCERLRAIRKEVARQYGLDYAPVECTHTGDCSGTCPQCDEELRNLQSQLDKKGVKDVDLHVEISCLTDNPGEKDALQGDVGGLEGMPSLPYAMPENHDRILYKQCRIAGTAFHNLEDIWDELYEGTKLALVRQKGNKHDKRAIAVALASDYDGDPDEFDFDFILGYVPRSENEQLAAMMDMGRGEAFECELSRIEGHDPRKGSLFMDIYIVKNKAVADAERLFWVYELGDEEYGQFVDELFGKGFAYFRWGGYPVWERVLPKRKSKVVVVNRGREDARLHLMRVMATTIERAGCFVENPDELFLIDDCSPFILTQVSGPLVVQLPELGFLDAFDTRKDNPFGPLPEAVSGKLLGLFRNMQEG